MDINWHPDGHDSEREGSKANAPKRMTQAMRLLEQYAKSPIGLTDEEAGEMAGLKHTGYWKRCSDLRNLGYTATLVVAGKEMTRPTSTGVRCIVSFITDEGEKKLNSLSS